MSTFPVRTKNPQDAIRRDGLVYDGGLWCVCWAGDVEDIGFRSHKGPPVERAEAERRMAWGRRTYPQIIYWLEKEAGE